MEKSTALFVFEFLKLTSFLAHCYLKVMRLFAALPLPDDVVERLTSVRLRLSSPRDGLRWSSPEQWHVTLQFFGELEEKSALQLGAALRSTHAPFAELSIDSLSMFTSKGILLAAVEVTPSLLALQHAVGSVAEQCGLRADSKPFHPHITLARSRGKAGFQTLQRLAAPTLPAFGSRLCWRAVEYLLVESQLTPQGAQYVTKERFPLGQSAASSRPIVSEL